MTGHRNPIGLSLNPSPRSNLRKHLRPGGPRIDRSLRRLALRTSSHSHLHKPALKTGRSSSLPMAESRSPIGLSLNRNPRSNLRKRLRPGSPRIDRSLRRSALRTSSHSRLHKPALKTGRSSSLPMANPMIQNGIHLRISHDQTGGAATGQTRKKLSEGKTENGGDGRWAMDSRPVCTDGGGAHAMATIVKMRNG